MAADNTVQNVFICGAKVSSNTYSVSVARVWRYRNLIITITIITCAGHTGRTTLPESRTETYWYQLTQVVLENGS